MISPLPIENLVSYLFLAGGALVVFGVLYLFKDQVEKKQRALTRQMQKKKNKKKKSKERK